MSAASEILSPVSGRWLVRVEVSERNGDPVTARQTEVAARSEADAISAAFVALFGTRNPPLRSLRLLRILGISRLP